MKLSLIKILKEEQIKHLVPSLELFDNVLTQHQKAIEIVSKIFNISLDEAAGEFHKDPEESLISNIHHPSDLLNSEVKNLNNFKNDLDVLIYNIEDIFEPVNLSSELIQQFIKDLKGGMINKYNIPISVKDIILKDLPEKWLHKLRAEKINIYRWIRNKENEYNNSIKLRDDFIYKTAEIKEQAFEKLLMDNKLKNIVSILPHKIVAFQNQGIEITDYLDEIWKVNEVVGLAKVYFDDLNFEKEEKILYDILADWS